MLARGKEVVYSACWSQYFLVHALSALGQRTHEDVYSFSSLDVVALVYGPCSSLLFTAPVPTDKTTFLGEKAIMWKIN